MVFDYVIVGAGSAGCVLANRLSADPDVSVLLLEAGGSDRHLNVKIPAAFRQLFRTERDWNYNTQPEPHLDGRSLYMPRGKMLGGCHSINAMLYVRGDKADYDEWRDEYGAKGWGWDDVLPYFKRSEHNERGPSEFHAIGGPMNVTDLPVVNPFTHRFLEACQAVGIPLDEDYNDGSPDGVSVVQVTQKRGARHSVVDAYLAPARKRRNLTIATGALVHRVVFDGGRAVGVEYRDVGGPQRASVAREVILSAGAIGSPHILQLSGIGPADHLREVGVDVVLDQPKVGWGLQDHPFAGVGYQATVPGTLDEAESPVELAKWVARRTGMLTSTVAEAMAFFDRDGDGKADLQYHWGPVGGTNLHGFEEDRVPGFAIGTTLIKPQSRGTVRLRSPDPEVHPDIVGNFLESDADMAVMVDGIEFAREIAHAAPFDEVRGREVTPGEGITGDELEAWIRQNAELIYHPTSTVAMGGDDDAPLDPELRLRGIEGLRVVDASVMPSVTRGNTNAPTIMIAEKAADLLLDLA